MRDIKVDDISTTKTEKGDYKVTYRLNLTTEFGDIVTDKYSVDLKRQIPIIHLLGVQH